MNSQFKHVLKSLKAFFILTDLQNRKKKFDLILLKLKLS